MAAIHVPTQLSELSGTVHVSLVPATLSTVYITGTSFPYSTGILMPPTVLTEIASWPAMMPVNAKKGMVNLKWRFEANPPGPGIVSLTAGLLVFDPGPPLSLAIFVQAFLFDMGTLVTTNTGEIVLPCDLSLFTGNLGNAHMYCDISRVGSTLDPNDTFPDPILFDAAFVEVNV